MLDHRAVGGRRRSPVSVRRSVAGLDAPEAGRPDHPVSDHRQPQVACGSTNDLLHEEALRWSKGVSLHELPGFGRAREVVDARAIRRMLVGVTAPQSVAVDESADEPDEGFHSQPVPRPRHVAALPLPVAVQKRALGSCTRTGAARISWPAMRMADVTLAPGWRSAPQTSVDEGISSRAVRVESNVALYDLR
jgi:hypothetical protein